MKKCRQCDTRITQDSQGSWVDISEGDGCDPNDATTGIGSEVHIPSEHVLSIGDHVVVHTDGNGRFIGTVNRFERDGNVAVIRPVREPVRDVFPGGYTLGRAHWNTDLELLD